MNPKANKRAAITMGTEEIDTHRNDFQSLSSEVVDLFQEHFFSVKEKKSEKEVCEDFSALLLRHWDLCSITTSIRGEDNRLHEAALYVAKHLDQSKTRFACALLAESVEQAGYEQQIWLDDDSTTYQDKISKAFNAAGLRAGIGVPLYLPDGPLVGTLIVVTVFPDRLRDALAGIRFVAGPFIIAVGNSYLSKTMSKQERQIEELVDELQERSLALEEANRELRRVALYRSLFLARLSHELRTPLTSILGFAEILLDQEQLTKDQRRFCEKIQSSGLQLETSLKQLVDLSRLEAGQTELLLQEFSMRETLSESCAVVNRLAQKQEVSLEANIPQDLPTIVSDQSKVRHVLYNFLTYAISRSPSDTTVKVEASYIDGSKFQIKIRDEGACLKDFTSIFEPIDVSASRNEGTNLSELGLVIARRLIDVIGGNIKLENLEPCGLSVLIELPARPIEP
jgi:signal transduction histidine kinase